MTTPGAAVGGRVFHTLDALRGLAAIGVVMLHLGDWFAPVAVPGGYLAVDLFFLMSGVVLSYAYEARFRAGMGTYGFMRARLIRLYPLYFVGTLLGIAVGLASLLGRNALGWDTPGLIQASALALLFVPMFSRGPVDQLFPLNTPSWSLFFELLVNLLFVLFWPLLSSRRLAALALLTAGVVGGAAAHAGDLDQGSTAASFAIGLARTSFGFIVGVLIARHGLSAHHRVSTPQVLVLVSVVGVAVLGQPTGAARALWDAVFVLLVFPLVVLAATRVDPGPRLQRLASFLGLTSYAVYVLHSPFSSVLNSVTRRFGGAAPFTGIVALVVLLLFAWLLDRLVDIPVRRHLNRLIPLRSRR